MVPVMHLPIHLSHYSHVCYVVSIVNTAVVKSLNLGGGKLGIASDHWSPMATTGYAASYWLTSLNAIPMDFSTFRPSDDNIPSILAFDLFLLFQNTYQRW